MQGWYVFVLLAFVLWGLWAFLIKLAGRYFTSGFTLLLYGASYFIVVTLLSLLFFRNEINKDIFNIGLVFIVIASIASGLANLFFYSALSKGNASLVVPLTALYPLITIILSLVILKESLSFYQIIGIVFALVAGVLLSM